MLKGVEQVKNRQRGMSPRDASLCSASVAPRDTGLKQAEVPHGRTLKRPDDSH